MTIEIGPFGERIPIYETREEEMAAISNFLAGNYGALTSDEVTHFRDCQEDPLNERWEREHAGELLRITKDEVEEALFVYRPCGETWEESWAWLRAAVGPHPITHLSLWMAVHGFEVES